MTDVLHITANAEPAQAPQAHDGSVTPAPVALPDLFYRARCASPKCKALLGGFYIPADKGMVVFSCPKCGLTTVFKLGTYGMQAHLVGPLVGSSPCPPAGAPARTRGRRGGKGR